MSPPSPPPSSAARRFGRGAVASPHYLASAAGSAVLATGGNAVDAVIAANLTLGVVAPYYCGYGGDLLAIVWDAGVHGYRSTGRAPASATIQRLRADGLEVMPEIGAHTVTVPGAVRGWFDLLDRFGTRSFEQLAVHAVDFAENGFPVTSFAAELLGGCRAIYADFPDFLDAYPALRPGDTLAQPGLARTIRLLGRDGPDAFYRGEVADAIASAVQRNGGLLVAGDLAAHEGAWVAPLRTGFRGVDVLEHPPPTQGVTALEALRILDGCDLADRRAAGGSRSPSGDPPDRHHMMIEAVKLALADRDAHVSDPGAMRVEPEVLCSEEWAARRRREIDPARAGTPAPAPARDGGTAYLCAADGDGLLVSLIQSNFLAAGCGVHVPGWGINLQSRGSSFSLDPAHVNALAPSKLPMHTLIPALALRCGQPWLVFGTMGGHGQAQTHVQVLTRMLLDGADPQQAVAAPRWNVDPGTWLVAAEDRFGDAWFDDLSGRGHRLRVTPGYDTHMGHAHAIEVVPGGYLAGSDPRAEGAVLGV